MNYTRDVRGLRRYILLGQAVSVLVFVFGLVSLSLFFDPSLVGTPEEQQSAFGGNLVWLFVGVFLLFFATLFLMVSGRWARRLLWIWRNARPEPMNLSIEVDKGSDHTSYYAILSAEEEKVNGKVFWKVSLYSPSWDVAILQGKQVPVKVHFDPKSNKPAVIETEQGLLWVMAGSGSVSRI